MSIVARPGSNRYTPLLPAICAKRAAATKPRTARTLPMRREYPSFQTSASDAVALTRACPDVLRSNRWTRPFGSDALAASRGAPCRRHGCAF
ncbi:hypothetical protein ACVCNH_24725 [Achromobacter anxifer]